jgi:hypothetical protein
MSRPGMGLCETRLRFESAFGLPHIRAVLAGALAIIV